MKVASSAIRTDTSGFGAKIESRQVRLHTARQPVHRVFRKLCKHAPRDCNPGIQNPGIPANFANSEILELSTHNPGIFGIENFPISVHYLQVAVV